MIKWAILATGPSLNAEDVELVRLARLDGRLAGVAAVSDAGIDMAPWADILVSHDSSWWMAHPEALNFKGGRFSARGYRDTIPYKVDSVNSGLMAMRIASEMFGARKLVLLGFDLQGSHYFGPHTAMAGVNRLKNTDASGFRRHIAQFDRFTGAAVVNATPDSALTRFPFLPLREAIAA